MHYGQFRFRLIMKRSSWGNYKFVLNGSDSSEDEVSDPTFDDLLYIYDEFHATYKHMKIKHYSLKKDFTLIEKTHNMTLVYIKEL